MLPKDTLTCELIPNAVKSDSLSCSIPPLEHLELWATNAGVASAAFTALLALFAYMAWRKQKETLEKMQDQIVAASRQAVDSRQVEFLVQYVKSLKVAADRCDRTDEVLLSLTSDATEAWIAWSMDLFKTNPPMREMTQWWNSHYMHQMKILRRNADAIRSREDATPTLDPILVHDAATYTAERELFYGRVGTYIAHLQMWQVDEEKRHEVFQKLAKAKAEMTGEQSK